LFFSLIKFQYIHNIFLGKNYPLWPCGDHVFKFKEVPEDWLQSGWALYSTESRRYDNYNAQFNTKKCLGTIQCKKCNAQVRPKMKDYIKKIEEQLNKGCSLSTCNGI
jgi:hypothetical protein